MRRIVLYLFMIICLVIGLAFHFTAEFLQTLNISNEEAENDVWYSFSGGYFNYPYSEVYHTLSASARVALVKEIGVFAKAYTRTEAFKKLYVDERTSYKPKPPERPQSLIELKDQYKESLQEGIQNTESTLRNYSGDVRKGLEDLIASMKEQLKQADNPDNPMFSSETEAIMKESYELQVKEYETKLADWENNYPVSPSELIIDRLSYFLEVSETVDFNAKLKKSEYGQMVFVNPDYESMDSDWKMIFRAGKESTDAARTVATQWLAEMK